MRISTAIIVCAGAASTAIWAQPPAFEAASVKVNHSNDGGSSYPTLTNGRLKAENATLKMILQAAYGLNALQISGPAWLDSDRYDLEAKSPQGVSDVEMMPMLQSLLKVRFQLMAHRETKAMDVYDLVVAKDGLKIALFDPAHIPPMPPRNGAASMIIGPMTISQLAGQVTRAAGRTVLNKTGLDGRYFVTLSSSPLSTDATGGADIFAAVQEQLGLRLEPNKEPLEILTVDHAERVPTEN